MYSRRFSEENGDLPPGYGGVALRANGASEKSDMDESDERGEKRAGERYAHREAEEPEDGEERTCRPRRPLYARTGREESEDRRAPEGRKERQEKDCEKSGGLLSSLFSISGRTFHSEDVILAGMILLLVGGREKGKQTDGELLLILCLLLFTN